MGNACCKGTTIDDNAEVELQHFNLLRSVGKGAFGKVRVVQHKGTKATYALKYINKEKCIKMDAVENIVEERKLLELIHCPFVCNLRYAFQDDENLFMVIDLMLGGDLRFHLDRMGPFKESHIALITAECALALGYLHARKIIHRDMKPDNVLLDEFGHAHLTDFNIAVRFRDEKPLTAVAGSMAYMAPEILQKRGYFASVDWWSLGVMVFEMATGKRPFRAKTNEGLTNAILYEDIPLEQMAKNEQGLKDLVTAMLERDVEKRLGVKESGGLPALKAHPFFKELDWEVIAAKKAEPGFVPDSKKANFDATHELEELLLEDNPLKARPRKKKTEKNTPPPNETPDQKAFRIMEEKFAVYDLSKVNHDELIIPSEVGQDLCENPNYKAD